MAGSKVGQVRRSAWEREQAARGSDSWRSVVADGQPFLKLLGMSGPYWQRRPWLDRIKNRRLNTTNRHQHANI